MKKLLTFVAIVAGLVMVPNVSAAECTTTESGTIVAIITNGNDTKYCTDFANAIKTAVDGDLITLKSNVTIPAQYIKREEGKSTFSLDLNGYTIDTATGSYGLYISDESIVTIKDSKGTGTIKNGVGNTALVVQKGTVILEGGNYENTSSNNTKSTLPVIQVGSSTTVGKLIVKNAVINGIYSGINIWNNSEASFEGGTINAPYGIALFSDNAKLNVSGGTITSTGYAVSGNGAQTTHSTINILGGNLISTEGAVIYQPQTGETTISGGTLTGLIGIVARQGTVNITGGKIIANGNGDKTPVGDAKDANGEKVQLTTGIAVIVDNTEGEGTGYEDTAKVNISGGTIQSTVSPVLSFGEDAEDITVSGGTFNQKVNGMYLASGVVQNDDGTVKTPQEELKEEDKKQEENKVNTDKKDKEPKTNDVLPIAFIGLLCASALTGIYTFKKN